MSQIKIIQHENPKPVTGSGDILKPFVNWEETDTGGKWYSSFPIELIETKLFFPLSVVHANSWEALAMLSIAWMDFQELVKYECPYTKYLHYWAIPTHIFTNDVEFWLSRCQIPRANMYADQEWMKKYNYPLIKNGLRFGLRFTKVQRVLLGSGYTLATLISDGNGQLHDALLALDNGDFLGTKVWVWFNK